MNYFLEHEREADRLHRQSQNHYYSIEKELRFFKLPESGKILDAGCGPGLGTQLLKQEKAQCFVEGCDASSQRLEFAKKLYPDVQFFQHDLLRPLSATDYSFIFNRFVGHHLGFERFSRVLGHFYDSLSNNGSIGIVDIQGVLSGLGTTDSWLLKRLELFRENFSGDMDFAKKIPGLVKKAGFQKVVYRFEVLDFQDEDLRQEVQQIKERFEYSQDLYVKILGSVEEYREFRDRYMDSLKNDALVYNKIILQAWK